MIKNILFVAIGGGIGSVFRYVSSFLLLRYFQKAVYLATFSVNIVGCLLIGLLIGYFSKNLQIEENYKLLLITGFCGGFTTFSTFALENLQLIQNGNYISLITYTTFSILLGIVGVWSGILIMK